MESMGKKEIIIGIILMILSMLFFTLSFQFPEQTLAFSPKIFPRFVSVCLFFMAAILVFQGITALRQSSPEKALKRPMDKPFLIRLLVGLLIGYAYTHFLRVTGYVVATPPFIAGIMLIFDEKRWLRIVATSVITTSVLYILFRIIFKVPLPRFSLF